MNLDDPIATALRVADALDRAGLQYALFGGLLLAAYGEARETRDVDLAVIDVSPHETQRALGMVGFASAVTFEAVTFGGLSISRLSLVGGDADTGLNVLDLVQARSPRYRAAALSRSVTAPLRDRTIHVLSADDFVLYKALATRQRDLDDAASVLERSHMLLDMGLIAREVDRLAVEIPDWDVRARWALIRGRPHRRDDGGASRG